MDDDESVQGADDAFYYASQATGAPGELLTLSFGPMANFVATHYWNAREADIDWDNGAATTNGPGVVGSGASADSSGVYFRQGLTAAHEPTYTPRALMFDLADGFGRVGRHGRLYIDELDPQAALQWDGRVDKVAQPGYGDSAYQRHLESLGSEGYVAPSRSTFNLEGTVRTWSDYSRTYFHPRSLVALPSMVDPVSMPVEAAKDIWNSASYMDWADEATDALRRLAEECGKMQGVQLFTTSDGWGGIASGLAEKFDDEIGRTDVVSFTIDSAVLGDSGGKMVHDFAAPLTLYGLQRLKANWLLSEHSSILMPLYVPRGPNHGGWSRNIPGVDYTLPYHTSYLVSTAIDTIGMPWRMPGRSLRDTIAGLRVMEGAKIAGLEACWPLTLNDTAGFRSENDAITSGIQDMLSIHRESVERGWLPLERPTGLLDFLSGSSSKSAAAYVSLGNARGAARDVAHRIAIRGLPRQHTGSVEEILEGAWGVSPLAARIDVSTTPVKQLDSSPDFFGPNMDSRGFISKSGGGGRESVESFPQMVRAYSSPTIGTTLRGMLQAAVTERRIERIDRVADETWDEAREGWEGLVGVYQDMES